MEEVPTEFYARLTATNMLLELLWAEHLASQGKTPDDIPALADRILAKWELFSPKEPDEYHEAVSRTLADTLARVRERVGQIYAEGRGRQSPQG